MKNYLKLIISLAIPFVAGGLGSIFTSPNIPTWYATLTKPSFTPPNWLFGPVWTTLYILIGIALYLVWINKAENKKLAYAFFNGQMILNALWSIVFFGLQDIVGGLAIIILMWLLILGTIVAFYKISKTASLILIPYILWVSLATALNYALMILN